MEQDNNQQPSEKPGFFASLAYADYRRLWIATATSQSAAWALIVLRGALVYRMTESNAWVGFATMAALLPSLVVTPLSGLLADRFDRRKVLAVTYGLNLGHTLLLAFLLMSGDSNGYLINEYHILVLAVFNGCIRATELPTNQALLPNLVPRERLLNAVALSQFMQQGSRMMGPLVTLPVIRFADAEPAFFVPAAMYALGWFQVATIGTVSRGIIEAGRGAVFNLVAGVRYVYTHPLLLYLVGLTVLHCALTMAFESVFPFFSRTELKMLTEQGVFEGPTYLMIAVGSGSMMGNLSLARVQDPRIRGKLFLGFGLLSGAAPMMLSFTFSVPTAMAAAAFMGATTAGFMTLSHGMVQFITPDRLRGRVMSANTWHSQGAMGGFNAVNGVLMDLSWMTARFLLSGTGLIFIWLMISTFATAHLRTIYSKGVEALAPT